MGCGRSTLGSDSPSRNSKEEEWNEGSGEPSSSSSSQKDPPAAPSASSTSTHQAIPFNHGGALLAQAKISGSQLDFFKVLDEKIENGPDYESEGEEESLIIRRSRLAMYLEQWNQITRRKPPAPPAASSSSSSSTSAANQVFESQIGSLDSVPLIRAPTTTSSKSGSGKTLENESRSSSEDDESDEPKEAVKEQYMFMGSLYTLTRFRSDGSYIPRVDVSPAHKITEESDDLNRFEVANTVLAKGSTKAEVIANDTGVVVSPQVVHYGKSNESVSMKVNGTFHKSDDAKVRKLERADTPYHHTLSGKDHIHPSRPASLVLRTVFPSQEEAS